MDTRLQNVSTQQNTPQMNEVITLFAATEVLSWLIYRRRQELYIESTTTGKPTDITNQEFEQFSKDAYRAARNFIEYSSNTALAEPRRAG